MEYEQNFKNRVARLFQKIASKKIQKKLPGFAYVEEQSRELCLSAVEHNGLLLEFVKEQTGKICLAVVSQYGRALEFVEKQTEEICMAAVQEDGTALQYVKEKTEGICRAAIEQNKDAIKYIKYSKSSYEKDLINKKETRKRVKNDRLDLGLFTYPLDDDGKLPPRCGGYHIPSKYLNDD